MPEKPTEPAKLRTYKREIPIELTDHEVELYGRKLAKKKSDRDGLTDKAKQVAATYKGEIAAVTAEVNRLAEAINTGKELRNTEVYDELVGSQVFTKRKDTDEVIDQRPASFADEQTDMFAPDPEAPPDEGDTSPADFAPPPAAPAKKGRGKGKGTKKPAKAKAN